MFFNQLCKEKVYNYFEDQKLFSWRVDDNDLKKVKIEYFNKDLFILFN